METIDIFHFVKLLCFCFLLFSGTCSASTQYVGQISPGLKGSQMNWIDKKGLFLVSNNSIFALGFSTSIDVTKFLLVITHLKSPQVVWTANRGLLVRNNDKFVFEKNGNAYLSNATGVVWSTNTADKGVKAMELQDNGNLVLLGANNEIIWQSFSYPTDTLLSGQIFVEGMKLKSFPDSNLYHYLEIKNGDLVAYVGYQTPQIYWSMSSDSRKRVSQTNVKVVSASIIENSWEFYDGNNSLVWQFNISEPNDYSNMNTTWAAVLNADGSISFYNFERGSQARPELTKIPKTPCSIPKSCDPYNVCSFDNHCQCPSVLSSLSNCTPRLNSPCKNTKSVIELLYIGERLDYFALEFVKPVLKAELDDCKGACLRNCSCAVLFYENSSRNCFLFDQVGSLKRADSGSAGVVSYVKVQSDEKDKEKKRKHLIYVITIVVGTLIAILALVYLGFRLACKSKKAQKPSQEISDEDNFLDNVSGMPIRFSYNDLLLATNNFSEKLGQGGFGSVYKGVLLDGSQVAVKKLEGIGQGKKEFRTEVTIIGSIHHIHLVKLKGFCAEGSYRLLVYEYMSKGSLDKWIFKNNQEGNKLSWEKRFDILLGMAKGLAYLHEGCDVKIVHCDIKPENVLLDDNFQAKVSDFGLAKLMTREQSHVFTVVRGTRGYLAPEWITNYAISEKSDVYSFGMVMLEIIGGRKNYDLEEISEKVHFPSYAFKMMEERKLNEILDSELGEYENDEKVFTAIKVALWCIQGDMQMRPSMSKVVQMLEGISLVLDPPNSAQASCNTYLRYLNSSSEEGAFSKSSDYNSVALLSDIQLSGPR